MTIFRCKKRKISFKVSNSGEKPIHVMTEPWCEEYDLNQGDVLEVHAEVVELENPLDPLTFEVCAEDHHVSIWCPPSSESKLIEARKSE